MFAIIVFLFGMLIGSFLNVCIYRIPRNENIAFPPSHCPICNHKIKWYENIPVISYLFLGGRCSSCNSKISIQYPIVELVTGALSALIFSKYFYLSPSLFVYFLVFMFLLVVATGVDLNHTIIPNRINLMILILGFSYHWYIQGPKGFTTSLIGASVYSLPFTILYGYGEDLFKREVLGFGDVKLAMGIGAIFGYVSLWRLHLFFTLAFVLGAVISLILIFLKIKNRDDSIPFGPYMAVSAIICMFLFI